MVKKNVQDTYFKQKVLTASPGELVLLLYDGFIKFCNIASVGIDEKNYEKANTNIQKAERIIDELQGSLDRKYEVSKDFDNIYTYVLRRLHEANIYKNKEILEECITHIRSLRETWVEVMKRSAKK